MPVLYWDKPKKVRTPKEQAEYAGFDGGPPGGYQPNMSDDDAKLWRAKITGQKRRVQQVEIRKQFENGTMLTLIVTLSGGYTYKTYVPQPPLDELRLKYEEQHELDKKRYKNSQYHTTWEEYQKLYIGTSNIPIHLASNGALQMTWAEMSELFEAVQEAKIALETLSKGDSNA